MADKGPSFEESFLKFIRGLRGLGVKVTTAETIDAFAALADVGLSDRRVVKAALKAVLAKSPTEAELFDSFFDNFFAPPEKRLQAVESRRERVRREEEGRSKAEEDLVFLGKPLDLTDREKDVYARLVPSDQKKITDFLRQSSEGIKVDEGFRPIIESMVRGNLSRWEGKVPADERSALPSTGDETVDAIIEETLGSPGSGGGSLLHRDLEDLRPEDLPRAAELTRRLAARLAGRLSRRYRQSQRRKRIDIRRTLRSNIASGGVLFRLKYRNRRVQKPKLLVLCDVSGSMRRYSSFVLQFIYGLSHVLERIESFLFADDLEHVRLREGGCGETIPAIVDESRQWGKGTDLSRSLKTLAAEYRYLVTRDTFVIIVSDSKTLKIDETARQLAALRQKVKDILWLNTLPRADWEKRPSVTRFQEHCRMFQCNTLADLERIIRSQLYQ